MKKVIDDEFLSLLEQRDLLIDRPMSGLFGGQRRSKSYGSSLEFADYRDYAPGDDLRLVDRNLYARFEKFYLKLFVDERQLFHRIYIDASASMDWGKPSKGETAVKIAAALSYLSVRSNDRVSLSVIEDDRCLPLCPPFSGVNAFYAAADQLNRLKYKGEADFTKALLNDEEPGRDDGISVILSDFLTDGNYKTAIERLIYRGRKVFLLQILTKEEFDPDFRGRMVLIDSEAQNEDDARNYRSTITHARIKAYKQAMNLHQKELKEFCTGRGVGYFTVCAEDAIETILFEKAMQERLIT